MDEKRDSPEIALREAMEVAGGLTALSQLIDAKPNAVHNWLHRGVPPRAAARIEYVTRQRGRPVLADRLCPDVDWKYIRGCAEQSSAVSTPEQAAAAAAADAQREAGACQA